MVVDTRPQSRSIRSTNQAGRTDTPCTVRSVEKSTEYQRTLVGDNVVYAVGYVQSQPRAHATFAPRSRRTSGQQLDGSFCRHSFEWRAAVVRHDDEMCSEEPIGFSLIRQMYIFDKCPKQVWVACTKQVCGTKQGHHTSGNVL